MDLVRAMNEIVAPALAALTNPDEVVSVKMRAGKSGRINVDVARMRGASCAAIHLSGTPRPR